MPDTILQVIIWGSGKQLIPFLWVLMSKKLKSAEETEAKERLLPFSARHRHLSTRSFHAKHSS